MPHPDLTSSWQRTWIGLGAIPPATLWPRLLAAYSEPQRHCHSVQHLAECLALLGPALHLAQHPGEVVIALWFHDAVCQLRCGDNESQSAAWARKWLFKHERRAVLRGFLAHSPIYNTKHFCNLLEAQARVNLAAAFA